MGELHRLHGGYGYMLEYPIARLYANARVSRIYGGTSEVMKTTNAKDLGSSACPSRLGAPARSRAFA